LLAGPDTRIGAALPPTSVCTPFRDGMEGTQMQPEWLRRYFQHEHHGQCGHADTTAPADDGAAAPDDVSRRDFVKSSLAAGVAAGAAAGSVVAQTRPAEAQTPPVNPMGRTWWPSPWGPNDERGANNRMTPAKALEAARLIRTGRTYPLSQVLEAGIPLFGARHVSITIPGGPTGGPFGTHVLFYNDEMFSGEIGQIGSQFDGLGHIANKVGNDIRYYNGLTQEQVGGAYGLQKLGIHNLRPFFTRGIMLDVATFKGTERLPINYVITVADVMGTLRAQGLREPGEGDAVLFHTGHSKLWKKFNDEYNKGCPGPGKTVANWLVDRKIAVVGADTWPVEAVPGEDANRPFECHSIWLTMNGIFINENLNLDELVRDRVYEFAWSFNPLMLKGATGSPGNSVAIA
jgi:kynurenine formamidase